MSEKPQTESAQAIPAWDAELECQALCDPHASGVDAQRPQAESISVASVWQMESPSAADASMAGADGSFVYRRDGHPNERGLARKLATLHGAQRAVLTAQGMSALSGVAWCTLRPGSRVWISGDLYGKTQQLFLGELSKWQVETRQFDPTDAAQLQRIADARSDLVLVETISNPRLQVPDLRRLAQVSHAAGAKFVVDNTFATHLLCRPLEFGADLVVESLGKLVNGHSDAMLGLVCGNDADLMSQIANASSTFGLASSPLDCYLTHRGLMSLALRLQRACANAAALADALMCQPRIVLVDYPGLSQHPQSMVARTQFQGGFGWMLTIHLTADRAAVNRLFSALRPEIAFVPSLGDASTTVSHPATTSHRGLTGEQRQSLGISEGTVRISCGLEPTAWLIDRFVEALH